jgi:hypothetical protein
MCAPLVPWLMEEIASESGTMRAANANPESRLRAAGARAAPGALEAGAVSWAALGVGANASPQGWRILL